MACRNSIFRGKFASKFIIYIIIYIGIKSAFHKQNALFDGLTMPGERRKK